MKKYTVPELLLIAEEAGIPAGYRSDLILHHKNVEWITKLCDLVYAAGEKKARDNMLSTKPTVQKLMDLSRRFRSAGGVDYDATYNALQAEIYSAIYPTSDFELPERPRTLFCTKCGHGEPTIAALNSTDVACGNPKCGYSAFVLEGGYEAKHLHAAYRAGKRSNHKDAGRYKRLRAVGGRIWSEVTDPKNPKRVTNELYDVAVDSEFPENQIEF